MTPEEACDAVETLWPKGLELPDPREYMEVAEVLSASKRKRRGVSKMDCVCDEETGKVCAFHADLYSGKISEETARDVELLKEIV
jgi:hypothetical protein